MNVTVKRIVELMFENTVMDEEVTALRDELMNNCQERFEDMTARGMTEDEAIAAVIESLKGMEEVIGQYPKKAQEPEKHVASDGQADLTFDPAQIRQLDVHFISEDVMVERSGDELFHVQYNALNMPYVTCEVMNGVLRIGRDEEIYREFRKGGSKVSMDTKMESKTLDDFLASIKDIISSVSNLVVSIGNSGAVSVLVPENWKLRHMQIVTTSGDVEVTDVSTETLSIETIGGDVNVDCHDVPPMGKLRVKTTSGDMEICVDQATEATLQTISGDIDMDGDCSDITVKTTSGDADMTGDFARVNVKTISGDMTVNVDGQQLRTMYVETTSGDVTINTETDISASVSCSTLSGDVDNRLVSRGEGDAVIRIRTISGNIDVE